MMQKSKSDLNLSKNNRTTSDCDGIEIKKKERKSWKKVPANLYTDYRSHYFTHYDFQTDQWRNLHILCVESTCAPVFIFINSSDLIENHSGSYRRLK